MGIAKSAKFKCCLDIDIHDFVEGLEGSFVHRSKYRIAGGVIYEDVDGSVFLNCLFNQ